MIILVQTKRQVTEFQTFSYDNYKECDSHYEEMQRNGWININLQSDPDSEEEADEDEGKWVATYQKATWIE